MNYLAPWEPLWQLAGWTMIHFLWIGTLLALALVVLRLGFRRAAPNVRYAMTLACFVAVALAPLAIATWLAREVDWSAAIAAAEPQQYVLSNAAESVALETANKQADAVPQVIDLAVTPLPAEPDLPPAAALEPAPPTRRVLASSPSTRTIDPLRTALAHIPTYLPWLWIIGTPLTFVLLTTGLIGSERLRRDAKLLADGAVYEATERLRTALKIGRRVSVAISDRVLQPVLVGIVRPMILLPPAAVTGWSPEELEMALLHELAHVRRWDNLVNLVQRVVEALLFFHPCVWLISRWLQADREQCCDAVVVRHTGEREAYADLLISVARSAATRRLPSAAVAMASHPLSRRVRRILQLEDEEMLVSKRTVGLVLIALTFVVTVALWFGGPTSLAEETTAASEASATGDSAEEDATEETTEDAENPDSEVNDAGQAGAQGTPLAVASGSPQSPFLPLEQQRIADLAFGMLGVEVSPIDEETQKTVKEKGFAGGVAFERGMNQGNFGRSGIMLFQPGDILVGLHVWPTPDFDGLGEVLRRDDLAEFNPLKYYVLREVVDEEAIRKREQKQQQEQRGEFGAEFGGFGGGGGEFGGRGGFSSGPSRERQRPEQSERIPTKFELVTGRLSFDEGAWSAEQQRLKEATRPSESQPAQQAPQPQSKQPPQVTVPYVAGEGSQDASFEQRGLLSDAESAKRAIATSKHPVVLCFGSPDNSKPCRDTFSALLKLKMTAGSEFTLLLLDVRDEIELTRHYNINRVPATFVFLNGKPVAQAVGKQSEAKLQELLNRALFAAQPAPNSNPREESAAPTLLYDGRTFDDWRESFETELKTERRVEAIKAIRAFGRVGRAREATEAMLKVGEPYSFNVWGSSSGEGKLVTAIVESLSGNDGSPPLPATITVPLLNERYAKDPEHYKWLLWHALIGVQASDDKLTPLLVELAGAGDANLRGAALEGLVKFDIELNAEATRKALTKNLAAADTAVAMNAASMLLDVDMSKGLGGGGFGGGRGTGRPEGQLRTLAPELLPQLFHENMDVRKNARRVLSYASDAQLSDLPKVLAGIASDPATPVQVGNVQLFDEGGSKKELELRRIAAIRTLAVLGPRAKAKDHWQQVAEQMRSDVYQVKVAAYVAALNMLNLQQHADTPLLEGVFPAEFRSLVDSQFEIFPDRRFRDPDALERLVNAVNDERKVLSQSTGDYVGGGFF